MTKRNIEIKVRLSRKEAENLNKQVKKCRLSREAYLRHLITGEVPREAPPPEYFAFMREMHYVPNAQVRALLKSPSPLADVFAAWEDRETSYMEEIWQTVTDRAREEAQKSRNTQKER